MSVKTRIQELNTRLAEKLTNKGVQADGTETTTALINKVDDIQTGGSGGGEELFNTFLNGEMTNFVSPKEAPSVRPYLFYKDTVIKTADLRNATYIGAEVFRDSTLEEVIFNDDFKGAVNYIGNRAFLNSQLTDVNSLIGFSLTSASPALFSNCLKLKNIYLPNVILANATQPFIDCSALEKVVIGATTIGQKSFTNCSSLTALVIVVDKMAALNNANSFVNTPIENGTGYIYVPKALIEEYKVATNWVAHASQFRAIEDFPEICGGAE